MILPSQSIVLLWAGWGAAWLAAAPFTARTVERQSLAWSLGDRLPLWGGIVLLMLHGPGFLVRGVVAPGSWLAWAGAGLVSAGIAVAAWARMRLGRNWSVVPALKEGQTLVRAGPYARVRHPIYTGILLALAGTVLAVGTPAALAGWAVLAGGIGLRIRREEALMIRQFGDAYQAYRSEVPALIPHAPSRRVRRAPPGDTFSA